MSLIEQRTSWDCAICANAMFLEKNYEDIFEEYGKPNDGYPLNKSVEYLWNLGLDVDWYPEKMPEKKAVVIVKSKNHQDKWHSIFYNGEIFFDPSKQQKYSNWFDVKENLIGCIE